MKKTCSTHSVVNAAFNQQVGRSQKIAALRPVVAAAAQKVNTPIERHGLPVMISTMVLMKGLKLDAIASATGVPISNIEAYIGGCKRALYGKLLRAVASFVGLDEKGNFLSDRVHVLQCKNGESRQALRVASALFASTKVVQVEAPSKSWFSRFNRVYAVGAGELRVVILSGRHALSPGDLGESCAWASKDGGEAASVVNAGDLWGRLLNSDFSISEFDELFSSQRLSWAEIDIMARIRGISRSEIATWIEEQANRVEVPQGDQNFRVFDGGLMQRVASAG